MKKVLIFFLLFSTLTLHAQLDTLVVSDYTKVMVSTEVKRGEVSPVTSLEVLSQVGFFMHASPSGTMQVCNNGEIYIWVEGKLIRKIDGCDYFDPKLLYSSSNNDTIFVSFTSNQKFNDFKCQLLRFEELQVIQEEVLLTRPKRNGLSEFNVVATTVILLVLGILIVLHPARAGYILRKSFTFKVKAYEFINTNFLSAPSLISSALLSITLGFLSVYLNDLLQMNLMSRSKTLVEFLTSWIGFSSIVFITLFIKRLLTDLISKLFDFKELKNHQMFDFINFNIFFFLFLTSIVFIDFVIFYHSESLITQDILIAFPLVLILFLVWFSLKFVNHSQRKKLVIISYLCATEIIPAVFLLSWFFE